MNNKKVYILSGIDGAGKTTLARKLVVEGTPGAVIVSANDYMTDATGAWEFDPKRLSETHGKCQAAFHTAIKQGTEVIIVNNTNLVASHRDVYVNHALKCGYDVTILVLDVDLDTAAARNVRGVPLHTLEAQKRRLDLLPGIYTLGFTPARIAA